jgi:hypothetical protein
MCIQISDYTFSLRGLLIYIQCFNCAYCDRQVWFLARDDKCILKLCNVSIYFNYICTRFKV